MYCESGQYRHETLFPTESDMIHYLIGYAGEAMKNSIKPPLSNQQWL